MKKKIKKLSRILGNFILNKIRISSLEPIDGAYCD